LAYQSKKTGVFDILQLIGRIGFDSAATFYVPSDAAKRLLRVDAHH